MEHLSVSPYRYTMSEIIQPMFNIALKSLLLLIVQESFPIYLFSEAKTLSSDSPTPSIMQHDQKNADINGLPVEELRMIAENLQMERKYEKAAVYWSVLVEKEDADANAWFQLSDCLIRPGATTLSERQRALHCLKKAAELNHIRALVNLYMIYSGYITISLGSSAEKDPELASIYLKEAMKLNPEKTTSILFFEFGDLSRVNYTPPEIEIRELRELAKYMKKKGRHLFKTSTHNNHKLGIQHYQNAIQLMKRKKWEAAYNKIQKSLFHENLGSLYFYKHYDTLGKESSSTNKPTYSYETMFITCTLIIMSTVYVFASCCLKSNLIDKKRNGNLKNKNLNPTRQTRSQGPQRRRKVPTP